MITLSADNLVKAYKGRKVVDRVSLEVNKGEIVGLLGPNGAGKTTTFYMITGIVRPDDGEVLCAEEDITNLPMYKRADMGIGYLAQEPSVFRNLTVEENIEVVLEMKDMSKKEQKETVHRLLEEFKLTHVRDSLGYALSGGERRRLYLLRLLMTKPNVLLLDEPTNDLDIDTLTVLEDYLDEFNGAVIVVSHDRYFLDKTMDQLFVIKGQGNTELYYGSMSDFLEKQGELTVEETKTVEAPKVAEIPKSSTPEKAKKMTYHEKKEWEEIEGKIAGLEASIEDIQEAMNEQAQDFAKLQELQTQLETLEEELANSYERWEYLAELV
mgnify:CR=1 FL=1